MRKMLFLFMCLPFIGLTQNYEWDIAFSKSMPNDLGIPFHMPERDFSYEKEIDDLFSYKQKQRVYVVREDSVFQKLFLRYIYTNDSLNYNGHSNLDSFIVKWKIQHHVDSIPKVDFIKHELVMYAACAQCLAHCQHNEGENSCHRNVCNFREEWFLRDKKKADSD